MQRSLVDHVGGGAIGRRVDEEILGFADARAGNVELAVGETCLAKVHAGDAQRLALALVDRHSPAHLDRELRALELEWRRVQDRDPRY